MMKRNATRFLSATLLAFLVVLVAPTACNATALSAASMWANELQSVLKVVQKELPEQMVLAGADAARQMNVVEALAESFHAKPAMIYHVTAMDSTSKVATFKGMLMQEREETAGYHWSSLTDPIDPPFPGPWAPRLAQLEILGPAEIYVVGDDGATRTSQDLSMRVPHFVETGVISRVSVGKEAEVAVIGSSEIRLRQPVEVDIQLPLHPTQVIAAMHKAMKGQQPTHLDVKNPYQINSVESRLKVQRIGNQHVRITPATKALATTTSSSSALASWKQSHTALKLGSLLGEMSSSLISLQQQTEANSNSNNNATIAAAASSNSGSNSGSSGGGKPVRIRKIMDASLQAAVLYEFAVEVEVVREGLRNTREIADVMVVKHADGHTFLGGVRPRKRFDTSAMVNGNMTALPIFSQELNYDGMSAPSPF